MEYLGRLLGTGVDLDSAIRIVALIFARMTAIVATVPFLGGPLIPGRLKMGIALVLTAFLYPFIAPGVDVALLPKGLLFVVHAAKELFVGIALGYVVALSFRAIEASGALMDLARGTTFVQVIAPFTGGQTSMLGQLYLLLYTVFFFALQAHLVIIYGFGKSFEVVPITSWPPIGPGAPYVDEVIALSARIFLVGMTIAAPIIMATLLTDVMLGVVNRAAPNIQVFWLGQPVKTVGGLLLVLLALEFTMRLFHDEAVAVVAQLTRATGLFAPSAP